jgi:hypothetical protein
LRLLLGEVSKRGLINYMIRKSISFPPELHAAIYQLAKENNRSFTQQVIWLLSRAIEKKLIVVVKDEEDAEKQTAQT